MLKQQFLYPQIEEAFLYQKYFCHNFLLHNDLVIYFLVSLTHDYFSKLQKSNLCFSQGMKAEKFQKKSWT